MSLTPSQDATELALPTTGLFGARTKGDACGKEVNLAFVNARLTDVVNAISRMTGEVFPTEGANSTEFINR